MNLLMFGPPGAGKGTQSALLVEKYNMLHISTGDLFRSNIKNNTPLGLEAKKYMDAGELVPDSVTIAMVQQELAKLTDDRGFILDGFPRTVAQAEALENLSKTMEKELDKVVFFEVPKELLVERLSGRRVCKQCGAVYHVNAKPPKVDSMCDECGGEVVQRADDKAEAIENRLKVYEEATAPVKNFYRKKGLLEEVNGIGSTNEVFSRVVALIN
ncbi:MAG: adenylate kinase [Bdellovibrionales bacterium]|nr:adenylate kinase [Bdellovibrionales bacterium]